MPGLSVNTVQRLPGRSDLTVLSVVGEALTI